ncbi:MAG: lipocalin-like domain-containing protein [Bradyrhizobium sp.]
MNRPGIFVVATIAALYTMALPPPAAAQEKSLRAQLVGTWKPVVIENVQPDGTKVYPYSRTPMGILIFSDTGHFSLQVLKPGVPHYASGNRSKGTDEEYRATVRGGIHFFGTYAVNEADRTFVFHIEGSSFPNYNGFDQKRNAAVTGDELKLTVGRVSAGGSANQVWRRVK